MAIGCGEKFQDHQVLNHHGSHSIYSSQLNVWYCFIGRLELKCSQKPSHNPFGVPSDQYGSGWHGRWEDDCSLQTGQR